MSFSASRVSTKILAGAALLAVASACGSSDQAGAESEAVSAGTRETGVVSYYGPGLYGNKTANGEILVSRGDALDPRLYTAAHLTWAFGTLVKVQIGSKCAVVRINDRGPYETGRILDLRPEPATFLVGDPAAMVDQGRQTIEVVSKAAGYRAGPGCSQCGQSTVNASGEGDAYGLSITKPAEGCGATKVKVQLITADGKFMTGHFALAKFEGSNSLTLPLAEFLKAELAKPAAKYTDMLVQFGFNDTTLAAVRKPLPKAFLKASVEGGETVSALSADGD